MWMPISEPPETHFVCFGYDYATEINVYSSEPVFVKCRRKDTDEEVVYVGRYTNDGRTFWELAGFGFWSDWLDNVELIAWAPMECAAKYYGARDEE